MHNQRSEIVLNRQEFRYIFFSVFVMIGIYVKLEVDMKFHVNTMNRTRVNRRKPNFYF